MIVVHHYFIFYFVTLRANPIPEPMAYGPTQLEAWRIAQVCRDLLLAHRPVTAWFPRRPRPPKVVFGFTDAGQGLPLMGAAVLLPQQQGFPLVHSSTTGVELIEEGDLSDLAPATSETATSAGMRLRHQGRFPRRRSAADQTRWGQRNWRRRPSSGVLLLP